MSRIKLFFVEKIKQGLIRVWITSPGRDIPSTFLKGLYLGSEGQTFKDEKQRTERVKIV